MKIKHRALALILSAIMVLTYMPALAFAEPSGNWTLTQNDNEFRLFDEEDSVELTAWIENYDEDTAFEYRWFKDGDVYGDWQDYDGDYAQIYAEEPGEYVLEARETENPNSYDDVTFNVRAWHVSDWDEYFTDIGESITLDAEPEGDIVGTVSYQWQKENPETGNLENLSGKTTATLTVSAGGEYRCIVTETVDDNHSWEQYYEAYVDASCEREWWAEGKREELALVSGEAILEVEIEEEDYFSGTYTYSWRKLNESSGKYEPITGSGRVLTVDSTGEYRCFIKDQEGNYDVVIFVVNKWTVKPAESYIEIFSDGEAELKLDFEGETPEGITYQWFKGEEDDGELAEISGETSDTITVSVGGCYTCRVYFYDEDGALDYRSVLFDVYKLDKTWKAYPKDENENIELKVGKTVTLETVVEGNYDSLSYQWCRVEWDDSIGDDTDIEIAGACDKTYTTAKSGKYACIIDDGISEEPERVIFWVSDEEIVEKGVHYYLIDNQSVAVSTWEGSIRGAVSIRSSVKFSDGKTYPVTVIESFQDCTGMTSVTLPSTLTTISSDAFCNTGLKSITVPASVSYIGEHALGYNVNYSDAGSHYTTVPGFTIFGKTGSAAQTYAKANGFTFRDLAAEQAAAAKAKADAEAKAREALRQGTPDNSLPKVKLNKPAAKKTSITVKWKKLTKKQLKKSKATHYEIWVSESSTYPAGATTKETIVKKSKSKWTCKGLKKNTRYFIRIRAIKNVGGVKHAGEWKQRTIKTKKK